MTLAIEPATVPRIKGAAIPRSAHLVGSIPADDAHDAMGLALSALGPRLRWLPDRETGDRKNWIIHIIDGLRRHPDLELKKDWTGAAHAAGCARNTPTHGRPQR